MKSESKAISEALSAIIPDETATPHPSGGNRFQSPAARDVTAPL